MSPVPNSVLIYSRSTADRDAAHPVCETVGEQTGNVIVHDLHLAALKLSDFEQADLVLLGILRGRRCGEQGSSGAARQDEEQRPHSQSQWGGNECCVN